MNNSYYSDIRQRSFIRYWKGLIVRWLIYSKYKRYRRIAINHGATIAETALINKQLAKKANRFLKVGEHSSVMTSKLDLRNPVTIGNNVIIDGTAEVLTTSHEVNSTNFALKNEGIFIDDYVWVAHGAIILPSCRKIGYGAIVGAGSCVVRDVAPMSIVGGNPAVEIKKRQAVHKDLIVESLNGGDYFYYSKAKISINGER